ncbi:glycosyltransferase family 2 protein [Lactarius hengduanensis]|nr:glycosyltransferase family 2 protein [Lactarius hengduanensis]
MKRQSTIHHQRLEAVNDLVTLSPLSDDTIVSCIRERFLSDTVYTGISKSALVAVNPHKFVPSNADSVLHKYAAEYRSTSEDKEPLPPHIFQLANNAYYHMRRTTQDQTIILNGETGSGKSENRRLAIKTLLELSVSNPGKKGSKLAHQVPAAEFVLESFGNARTLFNANASRFGKYTELQFTERGRLCGIKTLDYYLERNRVAGAPSGERNFHIFYYLFAGASAEERQHMQLIDKTTFRYLGQRGIPGRQNMRDDDAQRFEQLKAALKNVGFSKRHVAQTCQLIAAILHLGNLEFAIDRGRDVDAAVVRNQDTLALVADFLGVTPSALETALSYKTKLVKKELCTVFLDRMVRLTTATIWPRRSILYSFHGLTSTSTNASVATILTSLLAPNSLDQFCINFANERLQNFIQRKLFESHVAEYNSEGIARYVPQVPYFDNSECLRLLQNQPGGLLHIMDDQARRAPKKTDHTMVEAFAKRWANHSSFKVGSVDRSGFPTFTVNHFNGPVTYSSEGFLERNLDALNPDFVSLLRGSTLAADAGEGKAIATQMHPRNEDTIVAAQQPVKPMRAPSTRRKNTVRRAPALGDVEEKDRDDDDAAPTTLNGSSPCVAGEFRSALDTLFETLEETQTWYVFCVNPNDSQLPNQLEGRSVKGQIRSLGLTEIARRCANVFEVGMTPREFCDRYREKLAEIERAKAALGFENNDLVVGQYKVCLPVSCGFPHLEDHLRSKDTEEIKRNRIREAEVEAGLDPRGLSDPYAPYRGQEGEQDPQSPYPGQGDAFNQSSQALPLVANASPFQRADMYNDYDERQSLRSEEFDGRSRLTSKPRRYDVDWDESYAPSRNMFQNVDKKALLEKEALPGEIHDGETAEIIRRPPRVADGSQFAGCSRGGCQRPFLRCMARKARAEHDYLALLCLRGFVIAVLGNLICPTEHVFSTSELASHSVENSPNNVYAAIRGEVFDLTQVARTHLRIVPVVSEKSILKYGGTIADDLFPVQYHDFRVFTNDSRPDWYFESMTIMRWNQPQGILSVTRQRKFATWLIPDDLSVSRRLQGRPYGQQAPQVNLNFMDGNVLDIFKYNSGHDISKALDNLNIDSNVLSAQKVDNRNSPQCFVLDVHPAALSVLMVSVIGFKFLASVNFSSPRAPEDHDKFVICQVPCYTEGDSSLRRTIDSLAQLKYDDNGKLLVVICDDPNQDPEPLSAKQHNMGKVYSGLYETNGHVVGKPTERSRPGNRGKRDSQIMLMNFLKGKSLKAVHFNAPMSPMELEMYHQIKNVIGVNPSFYEYLFTVDADTTVDPLSVNRLILRKMIHDKKLIAVCGETGLANAKQSIITMMQVYEYFISHHLAKAFESLFGSVTCLPGCSRSIVCARPTPTNRCSLSSSVTRMPYTVAPDDWKVLLSQRRRWIQLHSTQPRRVDISLTGSVASACFSMRFIVMIDLLSTIIQPVSVAYIVYLVVLTAGEHKAIPTLSLVLIAAVYGLQALVFVLRRKWDMVGWMIFYIFAIPAFSFLLPLYSFWKMDDFSWGSDTIMGPPTKLKNEGYPESRTSVYGRETYYEPNYPRSFSPSPSQLGNGAYASPPGYQSGRNTPNGGHGYQQTDGGQTYHQSSFSRPPTNYLDVAIPTSRSDAAGEFGATGPSDADIDRTVQALLRDADLNSITKREIRRKLEEQFGVDLSSRKTTINAAIDRGLLGHA